MFQIAVLLSEHIPSSEILNFFGTASTSTSMSSQARPPPPPPNNKEERKEVNVNTPQRQQPVQQQQQYYWYPPYWYPPQYQPPPTNQQYQGAQSQHPQQPLCWPEHQETAELGKLKLQQVIIFLFCSIHQALLQAATVKNSFSGRGKFRRGCLIQNPAHSVEKI
nr:PREDICTED: RNA-binding protein 33-like [Bemisia tabaci]XP_018917630.1 PREDICTED: RNA-binding protein 33-like [Bemisia tabaci]